ncbi:hypothetical protein GOP47_0000900 [Adiantum capillus-veneris]|uniref:ABC transporter domain-containing protein n=1 Tax=Adiantum capillus-veneris TaxID=13818 RepID=A0A9D4ZSQ4_ADICA|nr:hypothetical protein GOP47_0000900 [Adiantum capillus-veneris]
MVSMTASLAEDVAWGGSVRSASQRLFESNENVFSHSARLRREVDDEEALKWAAIEHLPSFERLRTGVIRKIEENGQVVPESVIVTKLGQTERTQLLDNILRVADEDNERFLSKLRNRIDRVGIELPRIEIRFENLSIEADAYVGSRALPTLWNSTQNMIEEFLGRIHLLPSRKRKLTIISCVSGILKPCRMALLLGPPGSGKTTLLLALAGKLDPNLAVSGSITYNGYSFSEFVPQRTSAYISQEDRQIGEMTVRETLDFSGRCQGVGTRYEMLVELLRREKEAGIKPDPELDVFMKAVSMAGQETSIVTDYVMKLLGLDICADTFVGNEMLRGISGGQRKRVTTGEMLVGPARALFMDEISTGLDSSTTYQIVKCLRQSVHLLDGTMVVSLLQPAPETYELFDDIILLSEGQIVYQGPREFVLDFFREMGFKCPDRKSVPDFLQEVTSRKDQEQYWGARNEPYHFITAKEFADAFKSFHFGQRLEEELSVPFDKSKSHPASLSTKRYGLGTWDLFKACFWRELLLMRRNSFLYIFKTVQISVVSLITMTVFFRTELHPNNVEDGNLYLGALFFGLVNVMFNGLAEISLSVDRLPVFYKERDQMFYPAWASSIPTFIMRIPLSILESIIWVALTYYVIGFAPEASRFFRQFLLLFLVSQMAYSLFRFIGAAGRTLTVASTFGAFALMIIFVLGGFVISRDKIHQWWVWGYWISPMMYGQNALAINEFLAPRWSSLMSPATTSIGKTVLTQHGIFTESHWLWIGAAALIGYTGLFNVLFTMALAFLNPVGRAQTTISEETLQERCLNQTGKTSTILQFRSKRHSSRVFTGEGFELPAFRASRSSAAGSNHVSESSEEECKIIQKRGMVLPFKPLSISFQNTNYFVDMPAEMRERGVANDKLQLLRGVSGTFKPGVLTALVGVSGAGKTTLMDVLAGRKTGGYIEGNISISGYPKKQDTFARIAGYCEQTDIHSPNITVRESVVYSAWLRLPKDVDKMERLMFVDEVMELVELDSIQDAIVGLPGVNGLSTEQRKRLTIAVELVANPSIIFMDEPTSGLDARAAAIVMRTVRNTVNTGRTVVCTIHQPSIDIFEAFDELLLMKRGGRVVYAGPLGKHSHRLVEYFQAVAGVPKLKEGCNPATWILEITSPGSESHLGVDFADIYESSSLFQENQAMIHRLSIPPVGSKDLHFPTKYSKGFAVQLLASLWKQNLSYWRNPDYIAVRMFLTTVIAIMLGAIFWNMGSKTDEQQDISNVMGAMYAATLFLGITNANTVQPVVDIERTVFYREKAAGMYSPLSYAFAQVLIEVPHTLLQTVIYGSIVFSMMGFPWSAAKFFWFLYFMFCTFIYFTYYGMMIVSLTPGAAFAAIVSAAFYSLWNLFSGFMIPRMRIPVWWRWYYWGNPVSWTLYGLITSQLGDLDNAVVEVTGNGQMAVPQYLQTFMGYHHSFLGVAAGIQVGFVVLFAVVFAFCIRSLNFQKR